MLVNQNFLVSKGKRLALSRKVKIQTWKKLALRIPNNLLEWYNLGLEIDPMAAKKTILTVDSNPGFTDVLRVTLEIEGYNVMCANNGKEVFSQLAQQKPDLVFLGVMLPEVNVLPERNGLAVLSRLKGSPDTSSIPVVMLTADGSEETRAEAFKRDADGYITKPCIMTDIASEIHRLLGDPPKPIREKKRPRPLSRIYMLEGWEKAIFETMVMKGGKNLSLQEIYQGLRTDYLVTRHKQRWKRRGQPRFQSSTRRAITNLIRKRIVKRIAKATYSLIQR
ncbi:MAG: response regulator [Deltaproteobacteria bacterium]|nr:response regulator [Deltaproteobacteria bacterium]